MPAFFRLLEERDWESASTPRPMLAFCYGAIGLFWALKTGWASAIKGVLSILFGLLILAAPVLSALMLVYFLAGLVIAGGIVTIYLAFKLRSV